MGGSYTNCSDNTQPGVAPIMNYLQALLYNPYNGGDCTPNAYYLLNNYNPGYLGDPFLYSTQIMTNPVLRANNQDIENLYSDIQENTLPAVSIVNPTVISMVIPHPRSSICLRASVRRSSRWFRLTRPSGVTPPL
jgi:phospholipase C